VVSCAISKALSVSPFVSTSKKSVNALIKEPNLLRVPTVSFLPNHAVTRYCIFLFSSVCFFGINSIDSPL